MNRSCTTIILIDILIACSIGKAATVTDYMTVLENGYQYLDPRPEAEYVARETRLLIRFVQNSPADLDNLSSFIQVVGEKSGLHEGNTIITTDVNTIAFIPTSPFMANEMVDVTLTPLFGQSVDKPIEPIQYRFYVLRPAEAPLQSVTAPPLTASTVAAQPSSEAYSAPASVSGGAVIMDNGVSVPSDFPHVRITKCRYPADGYIFITYNRDTPYTLIMDNFGAPVWYRRGLSVDYFQVQKNGMITETQYSGYDQNFNWIKDFNAVNGYHTDKHELQVLEDGGYLLLGRRVFHNVDMSRFVNGGNPDATIDETCIQEFTAEDELIFQWRAWENLDIGSVGPAHVVDVLGSRINFPYMNAIDIDEDGHILVSNRYLNEVTKIHRRTGEIIWKLGGAHSDFSFVDDPLGGFWCQHDIRALGHHRYTIFDNGNNHDPPVSRVVEYELDPDTMTATLVWEYRADPDRYTYYMGNAQRLPNGNTLINFVSSDYPMVVEVNPEGQIEFEMDFVNSGSYPYRVFRFPWMGLVERPYLVVEHNFDKLTLLFNKFGDPNVAGYRVYGGFEPHPDTFMAASDTSLLHLNNLENNRRYYFRVTAVDLEGRESDFSNEETIVVYLYDPNEPGENMVSNGDFSQGRSEWTWIVTEPADAQWAVENGQAHISINDGGHKSSNIRLIQAGMKLVQGETYTLEFDAGAQTPRLIEVKVNKKDVGSYSDYSKMGPVYLNATSQGLVMKHFTHTFVMNSQTDLDGTIEINAGADDKDVYFDNVSLVRQAH
jgi:hypothetical protein